MLQQQALMYKLSFYYTLVYNPTLFWTIFLLGKRIYGRIHFFSGLGISNGKTRNTNVWTLNKWSLKSHRIHGTGIFFTYMNDWWLWSHGWYGNSIFMYIKGLPFHFISSCLPGSFQSRKKSTRICVCVCVFVILYKKTGSEINQGIVGCTPTNVPLWEIPI